MGVQEADLASDKNVVFFEHLFLGVRMSEPATQRIMQSCRRSFPGYAVKLSFACQRQH